MSDRIPEFTPAIEGETEEQFLLRQSPEFLVWKLKTWKKCNYNAIRRAFVDTANMLMEGPYFLLTEDPRYKDLDTRFTRGMAKIIEGVEEMFGIEPAPIYIGTPHRISEESVWEADKKEETKKDERTDS